MGDEDSMKTIGILGGMSWESTSQYYSLINELVRENLGGLHSAELIIFSFDFARIEEMQSAGDWDAMAEELSKVAVRLEDAGAELLIIATNTMHKLAPVVEARVGIPILHIADAVAKECKRQGLSRLGLLGTRFTMEEGFYRDRLNSKHGLEVIVPDEEGRRMVDGIIYRKLCRGIIESSSRDAVAEVIEDLVDRGAEGIILGCTELPLLIKSEHISVPRLDTTSIHVRTAVEKALE